MFRHKHPGLTGSRPSQPASFTIFFNFIGERSNENYITECHIFCDTACWCGEIKKKVESAKRFKDIVSLAQELLAELGSGEEYANIRDYLKTHFDSKTIQAFKMADHESGIELVKLYRTQQSEYDKGLIDDFEALLKVRKRFSPYEY